MSASILSVACAEEDLRVVVILLIYNFLQSPLVGDDNTEMDPI